MIEERRSGILLHISSLPSPFGIGDLGPGAYRFVDFLSESGQSIWQILPLNPTNTITDNSPYSSPSAFAGNRLFISPELLREEGLLEEKDLRRVPGFPAGRVDYKKVIKYKEGLIQKAVAAFDPHDLGFQAFREEHAYWLDDYAVFMWLKRKYGTRYWNSWPRSYRLRDETAIEALKEKYRTELDEFRIVQYLFFRQWARLKNYCWQKNVLIFGDVPIYVHFNSVDVWRHPGNYKLDKNLRPLVVAGAPPDAFSDEGQRWGNPVYDWQYMQRHHFDWWIKRIKINLKLFDWVRIDHFRAFVNYWEIPFRERTAVNGRWVYAPTDAFFGRLDEEIDDLRIVAEDLGDISYEVRKKIEEIGFPGMKILQFAFESDIRTNAYLPHNYNENCVVYTGTHDNNTTVGWFNHDIKEWEKHNLLNYIQADSSVKDIHWKLIDLALYSKAAWAIFPMQDVIGLGEEARMNTPGSKKGNWRWRLKEGDLSPDLAQKLVKKTKSPKVRRNFTIMP